MSVPLGAFELIAPLARGGMGEVWRARHRASGDGAAIKVLTADAWDDPARVRALRQEIHAVAGLDHPAIVQVYDTGWIDDEAAQASAGKLTARSQWLAMELCDGRPLHERAGDWSWSAVRGFLMTLLDALAHAHARGVLHRDIKPGNVLFGGRSPSAKLTDFGLAYALDGPAEVGAPVSGGTRTYAAPEQLQHLWPDQGPWTDLFALGVLAWGIVTGHRPWSKEGARELPPFTARIEVPPDTEAWLRRMLAPRIVDRYQLAADAAQGLLSLGQAATEEGHASATLLPVGEETLALAEITTLVLEPTDSVPMGSVEGLLPVELPPIPAAWQRRETPVSPFLRDSGLGLYGLRRIPVVDREEERDRLWSAMHEAAEGRRPRAVILRGPSGCGKSHLARWLLERAHEVGSALGLHATHEPIGTDADGLAGMLARRVRALDVPRGAARARLRGWGLPLGLDDDDLDVLLRWLQPGKQAPPGQAERHTVLLRALAAASRDRLRLLWLDDLHFDPDTVAFAERALLRGRGALLLVGTVGEESLPEQPEADQGLQRLAAHPHCETLHIGPLPDAHRPELVRRLLGLEPALASRVEARTEGNPLFAVHLVGDWVQRGLLVAGPRGYQLRDDAESTLPETLRQVWARRVDQLLAGRPAEWRVALQVAAVLGNRVEQAEWHDATTELGLPIPDGLLEELARARLVHREHLEPRWAFANAMLHEAVLEGINDAPSLHAACAAMLQTRTGPIATARRGGHLMRAGAPDEAIGPLVNGAEAAFLMNAYSGMRKLLDAWAAAMQAAQVPPSDPRWAVGWLLEQRFHRARGAFDASRELTDRTLEAARRYGWTAVALDAMMRRAADLRMQGKGLEAAEISRQLLAEATAMGDIDRTISARIHLGGSLHRAGRNDEARRILTDTLPLLKRAKLGPSLANDVWMELSFVDLGEGHLDSALRHAHQALGAQPESRFATGSAWMAIGEIERKRGDLDAAVHALQEARRRLSAIGHYQADLVRVNLAMCHIEQGDLKTARPLLDNLRARYEARTTNSIVADACHLGLLVCAVDDPSDLVWARHLERVKGYPGADPDFAAMTELAAVRAHQAGRVGRAREAWAVAIDKFAILGRQPDIDRCRTALELAAGDPSRDGRGSTR